MIEELKARIETLEEELLIVINLLKEVCALHGLPQPEASITRATKAWLGAPRA